jgi:hypothetical protein
MYIRSKTTGRIIEIENQIFARTSSSWGWMAVRNHHPRQDKRSCFKSLCVCNFGRKGGGGGGRRGRGVSREMALQIITHGEGLRRAEPSRAEPSRAEL